MTMGDKMRLFKKKPFRGEKITHMVLQGEVGTATHAVYAGAHEIPKVLVAFKVRHGRDPKSKEQFDAIEIEMSLQEAIRFNQQLIHSVDAATPHRPKGAGNYQFGE